MRALQLRAIAVFCPLGGWLVAAALCVTSSAVLGCGTIVQPLGEYQAAPGSSPTSDAPVHPGTAGSNAQAQRPGTPLADGGSQTSVGTPDSGTWPPVFNETDPDASTPDMPTTPACTPTTSYAADRLRVDMYMLLDANITLPITGLWEFVTAGIRAFVADRHSQGIGVGLRTFGSECDPNAYDSMPTVEVDVLPDNQSAVTSATEARYNFTASPMAPALEGGIRHQYRRATQHPDWKQVVVLLSDGFTQDFSCVYTESDLESEAASGFTQTPSVETHVLGFGFPTGSEVASDILARFSPLDAIARAGGTAQSVQVSLSSDPDTMNQALQSVRRAAQPCAYSVPNHLDPDQLSLVWTPGGELPRVVGAIGCGRLPGWYFDDPTSPKSIQLCPVSCQTIQKDDSQTAVLLYGCPPVRR